MLIVGFVLAQILIMAVVIVILKKMIFSDTNSAINALTQLDNKNREKAKLLVEQMKNAEKEVQTKEQELKEEEQKIHAESKRAALQLHEDVMKKAKAEAEEVLKKARAARESMENEARLAAETKMMDFCNELVNRVMGESIKKELNDQLVDEFVSELKNADLSKINIDDSAIEISSAGKISSKTISEIESVISDKVGKKITVKANEDQSLIGGVMMKVGTMIVDGSLRERFKDTASDMKEKLQLKYS